jgi:adenylate cyclase
MQKFFLSLFLVLQILSVSHNANAQAGSDTKAKLLEESRKQQQEIQKQNQTLQQQQDWHNKDAEQEIKKLNQEKQQQNFEIAVSRDEVQRSRQDILKAKNDLESKKKELSLTQALIDSAKMRLLATQDQLSASEMINKRIKEELLHQEDSIKLLRQERELQSLVVKNQEIELEAQKQRSRLYVIAAILGLSLFVVVAALFAYRQKTIRELGTKNKIIEEEKRRSDELLLNILPEEVMHELKAHGKTQARNFAKATVLFADIKDFTTISEKLSPDDLIEGLDAYFERFDKVIEKYGIEKIKTIGDAYVCAGGVPTKSDVNPHKVVQAALDFIYEIEKLKRERTSQGKIPFEFRIGLHTGQLVAGVIGIRKFAYDIWGDTVNMAARMQQASEAGKINISGTTYELVKDGFACIYRGKIEAKNKGQIDMYFVEKAIL